MNQAAPAAAHTPAISQRTPSLAMSQQAQKRLRQPLRRGRFQAIDGARAGLAPVSVADDLGQTRVYYLVDADTHVIEDARFLAFGSLASHPLADLWCDTVRGKTLEAAAELNPADIESGLRDEPSTPAFADAEKQSAFLSQIAAQSAAARDNLVVPPPPVEVPRYERKREQDWTDADKAWLPVSLLEKIRRATTATDSAIADRLGLAAGSVEITGLHDDFNIHLKVIAKIDDTVRATAARFVEEALRADLHPQITVTLAEDVETAS